MCRAFRHRSPRHTNLERRDARLKPGSFRVRTNHFRANCSALKQTTRRMPRDSSAALSISSMRPESLLHAQTQHQRSACFGVRFLLDDEKNGRRVLDGATKTKPRLQRNVADQLRRSVAQIERDQAESAALNEQIRGAQRLIDIPASNPEKLR